MKKWKLWLCRLAHFTWGVLTAFMSFHNAVLAVLMFIAFLVYELDEERAIRDPAYQEVLEFSLGVSVIVIEYMIIICIWGTAL